MKNNINKWRMEDDNVERTDSHVPPTNQPTNQPTHESVGGMATTITTSYMDNSIPRISLLNTKTLSLINF